jgi:hypothetical protein
VITTDSIPPDLHELEYARQLLEEILGWPAKSNLELIADCLRSITKSKKLTPVQAYKYLNRAITLAKRQSISVDRFFFAEGKYMDIRPEKVSGPRDYQPIDWKAVEKEQSTPEWIAANAELRATLARIAGRTMS